jgi:hypothetical protein
MRGPRLRKIRLAGVEVIPPAPACGGPERVTIRMLPIKPNIFNFVREAIFKTI